MGLVGRTGGEFQPSPNNRRASYVEGGFDPIGDQNIRMAERAGGNFQSSQEHVDADPDEGDPRTGTEIAGDAVRARMLRHGHEPDY